MTENPYESANGPHGDTQPKSIMPFLGRLILYGAIIALVVAMLLPATRSAREPARRNQCLNNVKQILLALQNYHEVHGTLPPAYTVDDGGNRLHSWRTLILPYMEQSELYEQIDLTKPWDDPANAEARSTTVYGYVCPSSPLEYELTTYMAVTGPEFLFDGSTPRSISDVKDGTDQTIAIIEVSPDHAVHWMSPEEADEAWILETVDGLDTGHPGVFVAGFLDGHAESIDTEVDREQLRAMLTIAGGEELAE